MRITNVLLAVLVHFAHAQKATPALHFDAVSVRSGESGKPPVFRWDKHSARADFQNVGFRFLVANAFGVGSYQLSDLPSSVDKDAVFTLRLSAGEEAEMALKTMSEQEALEAQRHMLQEVLVERFHLEIHWTTRDIATFLLVAGKDVKLRPSAIRLLPSGEPPKDDYADVNAPTFTVQFHKQGTSATARGVSMARLAAWLRGPLKGPVLDKTGLTGLWDFRVDYSLPQTSVEPENDDRFPPLEAALADQLGLRVDHAKAPSQFLVIDRIEQPTPN